MNPASELKPMQASADKVYAAEVMTQVPRLLSMLDREPESASCGSFDREHWAWKFRDFPLTMLQAAIHPLALLWRCPAQANPYYRQPELLRWIEAGVQRTCARQHRNGAFDSVAPHAQSYGVTLAMIYALTEVAQVLGEDVSTETVNRIRDSVCRGCEFALRGREDYAFISNHQALFALAWLNAGELLNKPKYRERAEEVVADILRHQSPEGWYREYDGADPGYESLGIFYLAEYGQRTGSERLLESLRRCLEFYSHCVHPDGSVGGAYGSRHTQLYFPGGFEILAGEISLAASIAAFMRERLSLRNVLTPIVTDAENLIPLMSSYLEACLAPPANPLEKNLPKLPCEELQGTRRFPDAGIVVVGTQSYYAVIGASKGGVCRIFDRATPRIAYEDSGYVVRAEGRRWTSQHLGASKAVPNADGVICEVVFSEVLQELLTPAKSFMLRLMSLTLFRSRTLGEWLQRRVVHRLIRRTSLGPLRLRRAIRFRKREIFFSDRIERTGGIQVREVSLPRSFLPMHMGSAKYFHPSELVPTPQAPVEGMAQELNQRGFAQMEFILRFFEAGPPELRAGHAELAPEMAETEASPRR